MYNYLLWTSFKAYLAIYFDIGISSDLCWKVKIFTVALTGLTNHISRQVFEPNIPELHDLTRNVLIEYPKLATYYSP